MMSEQEQEETRKEDLREWIHTVYDSKPHSARRVWERLIHKDFKLMAPGLRETPKHEWVLVFLMIVGAAFAGSVGALWCAGACPPPIGHPPLQLLGDCGNNTLVEDSNHNPIDCVTHVIQTITGQNGAVQYKNVTQPAGTLYYMNQTKVGG